MRQVVDTTGMTSTVGSDCEPVLDFEAKQPSRTGRAVHLWSSGRRGLPPRRL
jgi:hypothetical protein